MEEQKVGRAKTNPTTILGFVRLPVELKEYAGKWAHISKLDDDVIVVNLAKRIRMNQVYTSMCKSVSVGILEKG
ncbi:MAG: hypothetical protein PWQ58_775 [Archaeoglobaceae archaeon]|nr:hypothetical protein [Archaeoglobaceae archaeon]